MVYVYAITLLLMIVIIMYRKFNNRYRELEFKIRLYELRDNLRSLAIEEKVNVSTREYDYTDFSITKAIEDSYYFTLFYVFVNEIKHEITKKDIEGYRLMFNEINEKIQANVYLKEINFKRNRLIWDHIYHQNLITIFLFKHLFLLIFGINHLRNFFKKKISNFSILPETSGINLAG
jgi:hypothetical protein